MKKFRKIGFWIAVTLLAFLTIYNLSRLKVENQNKANDIYDAYSNFAEEFSGLEFPVLRVKNVINDASIITQIDKGFIILLSNSGCNPCQLRELKNLEELFRKYNSELTTIALYAINYNKLEALRLRKISEASFPFCFIVSEKLDEIYLNNPFPKILFIKNQKIYSVLIPIPEDDFFSKNYYDKVVKIINTN